MILRVGKVIETFPDKGRVQVSYEDTGSSSLPLPLLTMNREYTMPHLGDMVVTLHFENGSSRGICLGTYYGGSNLPQADEGYRKDFDDDAKMECLDGELTISAKEIFLSCEYGTESLENLLKRIERLEDALSISHNI